MIGKRFVGEPIPELEKRYLQLSLKDIDLDFAGRQPSSSTVHRALASLEPGDLLTIQPQDDRFLILDAHDRIVGRTAKSFELDLCVEHCEVAAILVRHTDRCDEQYRAWHKCEQWELVVPLLTAWRKK